MAKLTKSKPKTEMEEVRDMAISKGISCKITCDAMGNLLTFEQDGNDAEIDALVKSKGLS